MQSLAFLSPTPALGRRSSVEPETTFQDLTPSLISYVPNLVTYRLLPIHHDRYQEVHITLCTPLADAGYTQMNERPSSASSRVHAPGRDWQQWYRSTKTFLIENTLQVQRSKVEADNVLRNGLLFCHTKPR